MFHASGTMSNNFLAHLEIIKYLEQTLESWNYGFGEVSWFYLIANSAIFALAKKAKAFLYDGFECYVFGINFDGVWVKLYRTIWKWKWLWRKLNLWTKLLFVRVLFIFRIFCTQKLQFTFHEMIIFLQSVKNNLHNQFSLKLYILLKFSPSNIVCC